MRPTRAVAAASLTILFALPSAARAQYAAPAGVQRLEVVHDVPAPARQRDTIEVRHKVNTLGAAAGGVFGAMAGAAVGTVAGAAAAQGCHGEFCGLGPALLGFAIGEPLGLAVGTHVGSGGHGNVPVTALSAFLILVGGAVAGAKVGAGVGPAMAVVTPVIQIAAAVALAGR